MDPSDEEENSLPYFDEEDLKPEIQTQDGFLKEIKDEWVPDTSEMGDLALEKYEQREGTLTTDHIEENFNEILQTLFQLETEIYAEKEDKFIQNLMEDFIQNHYSTNSSEYQNTNQLLSQLDQLYEESDGFEDFFARAFPRIYPLAGPVYYSASQGRKTRVGNTLETHIETLLERLGYHYESQVQLKGARVDIVLPNKLTFEQNPEDAIFLACQTTLKDRFRLSHSKLPSGGEYDRASKYITTATGINLVTNNDRDDITESKIEECVEHDYNLLVFDEVKNRFSHKEGIISYTNFANNILPKKSKSWDVAEQSNVGDFE